MPKTVEQLENELITCRAEQARLQVSWRCFHCDEVFTDCAEAKEHFGDTLDDSPLCLIKGQDGGLGARIRELETEVAEALNQRNEYENDARLWHESEADRVRRIGNVQWWQELDSREGEKLALEAQVSTLTAALRRYGRHEANCKTRRCVNCDQYEWLHDAAEDLDEVTCLQRGETFLAETTCTCGLDTALCAASEGP